MPDTIFETFVEQFLRRTPDRPDVGLLVVEAACTYQLRCRQGNKDIFHLEAFLVSVACIVTEAA